MNRNAWVYMSQLLWEQNEMYFEQQVNEEMALMALAREALTPDSLEAYGKCWRAWWAADQRAYVGQAFTRLHNNGSKHLSVLAWNTLDGRVYLMFSLPKAGK